MLCTQHGNYKKFCFHNLPTRNEEIVDKAQALGYDFIETPAEHAEVAFRQFFLTRAQENTTTGYYTHIVGLECSRQVCSNCDSLLQILTKHYEGHDYADCVSVIEANKSVRIADAYQKFTDTAGSPQNRKFTLKNCVLKGREQAIDTKYTSSFQVSCTLKELVSVIACEATKGDIKAFFEELDKQTAPPKKKSYD